MAHSGPGLQVAGRVVRVVWLLFWAGPPLPTSRNFSVPAPTGASTASQYRVPAVTLTEFHAPFVGPAIVPCVSSVPGLPLVVCVYRPTTT